MQWVLCRQNTLTSTTWCCSHYCIVFGVFLVQCKSALNLDGSWSVRESGYVSNIAMKFEVRLMSGYWLLFIFCSIKVVL